MLRKVPGFVVVLLGALATALSAYALTRTNYMAGLAEGAGDDRSTWIFHWQFTTAQYGVLSLLLLTGGCLILAKRSIGALIASVTILLTAVSAWVASAVGFARYPFEMPNAVETVILVGLSGFLLLFFLRRDLWNEPAPPNKSVERTRD